MATKIVVLDGYTLNPGDISWAPIDGLGELVVHERSNREETVERAKDATIALTNKTVLDADTLAQLPDLKYVGVLATGVNVVDLDAARARGITVTNVPAYSTASVAQHVFALLLELTNQVAAHDREVHDGRWAAGPDFSFTVGPLMELDGKTLGIIGLGAIGRRVAAIGHAMGMKIATVERPGKPRVELPGIDITWLPLDDLFAASDALTLHCPLTDDTKHMVNADRLALMKPTAFLINTGRGPLVDEAVLAQALNYGTIAGAGLDVLSVEPPTGEHANNPLLTAPRCVLTPHNAWATREARQRLTQIAGDNLAAFLSGSPVNVVNR